jgi:hypothetical protein
VRAVLDHTLLDSTPSAFQRISTRVDVELRAGLFTLWLMLDPERAPAAIYALEPVQPTFRLLSRNIAAAGVQDKVCPWLPP